jgi:MFS family permease
VAVAPLIPVLLVSIPAGALVDRVDIRRMVMATQAAMMLGAAALAGLVFFGHVEEWHIVAYAAFAGTVFAVDAPARQAFVTQLVPRDKLTNAIALNAITFNTARVAGGLLFAGAIWLGTELRLAEDHGVRHLEALCLALNVPTYGCFLLGLWRMRDLRPRTAVAAAARRGIAGGLGYAARTPHARGLLLLVLVTALFGFQVSHLLPVYAEKVWGTGKEGFGELSAALGTGALAGGLAIATFAARVHRGKLVTACSLGGPFLLYVFAGTDSFAVGLVSIALAGFVMVQTHVGCNALLQSRVPDELRGRVMSLFTLGILSAFPLGGLMAGFLSKEQGAPMSTFVAATIVVLAAGLIHLTHPALRRSG